MTRIPFGEPIRRGDWVVRLATGDEFDAVLDLRARAFRGDARMSDRDSFDRNALHLWVGRAGQGLRATLRLRPHMTGDALLRGYAAQFYDLAALADAGGMALELGRLCRADGGIEADLMRLVWAGVARIALNTGAARLVGCTSFATTDADALGPALRLLRARHLGPAALRPGRKSAAAVDFPHGAPGTDALLRMPPLLRAYLAMGGWVSDHLVIDRDLGTCHVFTCVEIAAMPAARRRALTHLAAG